MCNIFLEFFNNRFSNTKIIEAFLLSYKQFQFALDKTKIERSGSVTKVLLRLNCLQLKNK